MSKILLAEKKAAERLLHVEAHAAGMKHERLANLVDRIVGVRENFYACFLSLQSHSIAEGMRAWFAEGNLIAAKNWFYVQCKLEFICTYPPYRAYFSNLAFEKWALQGLFYLISENEYLIRWYSSMDNFIIDPHTENTRSFGYWTKHFFLALRGEWDVLAERCERVLADPPTESRAKKFIPDHKFYLALAKGDVSGMEAVIEELVTPKAIANRIALEGGYTADLICTPAIIYSKLAWRHGYEIVVDSPYIPKEWLPIAPLEKYEDPFEFMKKYDPKP